MTKLVVVTVVKNDLTGLRETLKSFAEQSATARLIVIDGFSTDGTFEEIQEWQSNFNFQVIQANDNGPYAAMNRAVDMLNDEDYVWFMNAGDLFGSSESINEVLVVLRRDEPVWAYGSFAIIEEDGTLRGVPRQEPYSLLNHAYGQTPICHQAVITRVAELRHVGTFDLRFKIAADWKALLSLSVLFDPAVINSTIARYRAGGISDRTILKNIREQRQIRRAVLGGSTKTLVRDNSYDLKRVLRFLAGRLLTLLVKAHLVQPDWRARRDM